MLYFIADSRDGAAKSGCNVCCCESFSVRPGETNKVSIDYAGWAAFTAERGLSCGTEFSLSECQNCGNESTDFGESIFLRGASNVALAGDLKNSIIGGVGSNVYTFAILPLYGPNSGKITAFNPLTGVFTYMSNTNYAGYDKFFFTATDQDGNKETHEVAIVIDNDISDPTPYPDPEFTPAISIDKRRVKVNRQGMELSFPIEASPDATVGNIYRLEIRQPALDCDCGKYWHVSCYDISIGKCG